MSLLKMAPALLTMEEEGGSASYTVMLASSNVIQARTRRLLLTEIPFFMVKKITPKERQAIVCHGEPSPHKQVVIKTHAKCILMSHGMTKGTNFLVVNHNQMSFT